MDDNKLIETLTSRIANNPSIVPRVLEAVSGGMAAWQDRVMKHLDHRADYAISSALGLPKDMSRWKTDNHSHAAMARLTAVGWGLNRRKPSSRLEIELVEFVREADSLAMEDALGHYKIMDSPPVPQSNEDY